MTTRVPSFVGLRPALEFPENPDDFLDFLNRRIADRFLYNKMDDAIIESIRQEAHQLLSVANDVYRLGVSRDFWEVKLERVGDHSIQGIVRPASLDRTPEIYAHAAGGYVAQIGEHFVRGPTMLDALVGLGKVFEKLGGLAAYELSLIERSLGEKS